MKKTKVALALVVIALVLAWFLLDLQSLFTVEYFQAQRDDLLAYKAQHFWLSSAFYFLLYVTVAALSLPAAALITVAGGAIFGFWWALLLVSFASTIGATLAFLLARSILRDWVQQRFGHLLGPVNEGIARDGVFYLFTLRLVPLFPFVMVNVLMALTPISTLAFYGVSQLGMLFGTALYVNLGSQLGMATSLPGVFSIGVIRAILVLALFPWLAKALLGWLKRRRQTRRFPKPRRFDTNLVVIGGGSAGLVTAYIAALVKARVTLVERHRMGGDCLNTGCVPSKALLRSAGVRQLLSRAAEFGFETGAVRVDFPAVMARIRAIIRTVEPHDSAARYGSLGVDCIKGSALITSPYAVTVDGRTITTRSIVIATGARPFIPDIPGLRDIGYLTSETVWNLQQLPGRLLVMGGGPIGCELAQAFARLGSRVTLVDRGARILAREDVEVSQLLASRFVDEGITLHSGFRIIAFKNTAAGKCAVLESAQNAPENGAGATLGNALEIAFDEVLVAVGRKPNIEGLGLDGLDMELAGNGAPVVDAFLQTSYPNIFACGDVVGPYQFTHMAAFQAWYASVNSLFGSWRKFRVNYRVVPWTTFTDPEVAHVGLNESEAVAKGVAFETSRFALDDLDRAIADGENHGFIKVLTVPGRDRILGVTIVGAHAAELLAEFTLAMTHGLGLKKILATIHVYPTYSESNKYVAGQWRRQHAPAWLYPWLERFHRWRRRDGQ
jgi:pyruvate/2-oxoglutarate dehydrogenase complex dihydrolipoamide dehydrogenase (E3) component/uncharacterized membrane protein YdjX (TVP38/TMEM64 family)